MSPIISVPVSYELCILCVLILWIFLILIFWSLLAFRWKILSKPWWFPQKRRDIRRVWPGVFNYKYFSCVHSIPRYAISLLFAKKFILEQEMTIHSSSLAWKIPWAEEPSRLQLMGLQRVEHDWVHTCPHKKLILRVTHFFSFFANSTSEFAEILETTHMCTHTLPTQSLTLNFLND